MEAYSGCTNIATNTTTTVFSGVGSTPSTGPSNEGLFGKVMIGSPGAAGGTITITDGAITLAAITVPINSPPAELTFNYRCATNLVVVTAGMTLPSVSIVWR